MAEETLDTQAWTRGKEKLSIGDATLRDIAYMCWSGASPALLEGVLVRFDSSQASVLLGVLTAQWGTPYQSNKYIPTYLWGGDQVDGYLDSRGGILLITHRGTREQHEAAVKARAAAAGADL